MLILKKLTYKNILSVGNVPIEIDFDNKLNTLIVGKNGHGKSLMLSALVFALYGKDFRGINKGGLVNSINKKNLVTECVFERNGITFKVVRGIKPNIFEIYKDGVILEQSASVRDQQSWFESDILQFPYNTFKQIVVTGTGNYIPFMKLTAAQRREFIENLFDLNVISEMQMRLKDRISETKDLLKNAKDDYKMIEERIKFYNQQIDLQNSKREEDIKQYENQKIELHDENTKIDNLLLKLREQEESISKKYDEVNKNVEILNNYKSEKVSVDSNIQKLKNKIEKFESLDSCPTCLQVVGEEHKTNILESVKMELEEYSNKSSEINDNISEYLKFYEQKEKILTVQLEISKKIGIFETNKGNNLNQLLNVESSIQQLLKESPSVDAEKQKAIHERNVKSVELNELIEKSALNDALVLLLKDTGIKSVLIKQYVDIMNRTVNKYLEKFEFFVEFNLDEQFNEKILSRHRDEFTYANFSEGEKARIDLSLLFTFREIAKMKSNLDCNLIFFDEILDSSMDGDGLSNLYSIFEMLDDTTVYVISHRTEAAEMFDRTLVAVKKNNFSTMGSLEK